MDNKKSLKPDNISSTLWPWHCRTVPSSALWHAVESYLNNRTMTPQQIVAMRGYLRQWIMKGNFLGPMVDPLRTKVDEIDTQADIKAWLTMAARENLDPL